jgi:hypothetical protein
MLVVYAIPTTTNNATAISLLGSREFGTRRSTNKAAIITRASKVLLTIQVRGTFSWL